MKRFFQSVDVNADGDVYRVVLDGRPIRTPEGSEVVLPTRALADRVASEWAAQEETISPLTMPATRLACTAVDKVAPVRDAVIDQLTRYGENDLLCYRSEGPDDLIAHQAKSWQPILDWLQATHGVALNVTHGIVHVPQPGDSIAKLGALITRFDDFKLAGFGELTQLTGSLALALSFMDGEVSGESLFLASQLDDDWQADKWGEDSEAVARRKNLQNEIAAAVQFIEDLN